MNELLLMSKEERMPIELMYMSEDRKITYRRIIVTKIQNDYIQGYCFLKKQPRTFKRSNILAAAKPRQRKEADYM
jgi:predicted DNA-binding transcriptional regulator YafY